MPTTQPNKTASAQSLSTDGLGGIDATLVRRMAEQSGLTLWPGWVTEGRGLLNLINFAKAVADNAIAEALVSVSHAVAEEREACAELCESLPWTEIDSDSPHMDFADAIRKRSNV